MRLGLIGCGALGSRIARGVSSGKPGGYSLVGVLDIPGSERANALARETGCPPFSDIQGLLGTGPDIVVEAASREAVWEFAEESLAAGASLIVCSSGALLDGAFRQRILDTARLKQRKIYIPSGALGALDVAHAVGLAGHIEATLVTRKPPEALHGAPFLKGRDLSGMTAPEVVFSGSAQEGIDRFPQNVNVAASLGLALGDADRLRLSVVADPSIRSNIHRWEVDGPLGQAMFEIRARHTEENQKSSEIAAFSVLALLDRIVGPLEIG